MRKFKKLTSTYNETKTAMHNKLFSHIKQYLPLILFVFVFSSCNYKDSGFFSPLGDIKEPNNFIPSIQQLEGSYDVNYTYTQNTCNDLSDEFNVTAGIRLNPINTNWMDVFFPDAPGAISGPYDQMTGNFMGETDRKSIGQGYTAMEKWDMDIYPRMSSDDNILFGGISRVDVYDPSDTFYCGIDYMIFGTKISGELPLLLHKLTVEKDGEGTVSSTPAGINCGDDCSEKYEEGTKVTLVAKADDGWRFDGWSGDVPDTCSDDSNSCTVEMNGDKTVKATFVEEDPFETFIFEEVLVCIEHGSNESDILWLFEIAEFAGEELEIEMIVILPNGDEEIVTLTSYSDAAALFHLDIFVTGIYDWEILSVNIDGEEFPFDGLTSGTVNVTGSEENKGQCTIE